jgi:peptidoglycan LD-endopeptidase CwlK
MFKFSDKSEQLLNTVDKRLGILANEVLKISPIQFEVIEGWRSEERQKELFKQGKSKTLNSMHLKGLAIDILCTEEGYKQAKDIFIVVGLFIAKAKELNINIRVGALWNKESTIDNKFIDAYHIELV